MEAIQPISIYKYIVDKRYKRAPISKLNPDYGSEASDKKMIT